MKSFVKFFKDNYMLYESIINFDQKFLKHFILQTAQPSEAQKIEIQQQFANKKENTDANDLESIEWVKQYQKDPHSPKGEQIIQKLTKKYAKLVQHLVWKQQSLGTVPQNRHQELYTNGLYGIVRAADKYDPSKGVPFLPYLQNWVLAEIKNPFDKLRQVSIHGDNTNCDIVSVDKEINTNAQSTWGDKATTVGDTIQDPRSNDQNPIADNEKQELRAKYMEYLKRLPEKELTALKLYTIDGKPYEEIGNILHMSKQAAKYFCDQALAKVRQFAREEGYDPDQTVKTSQLRDSY